MAHSVQQRQRLRVDQAQHTMQSCAVIQNVLECGIASVCRLRGLFPPSFFAVTNVGETSVTSFNESGIQQSLLLQRHRNAMSDGSTSALSPQNGLLSTEKEDRQGSSMTHDDEDDNNRQHIGMSPLTPPTMLNQTMGTLANHQPSGSQSRFDDEEDRMKAEVLLLLKWLRDGAHQMLADGKLRRVVFGVCLPSFDGTNGSDKLLESYAFDIVVNSSTNKGSGADQIKSTQVQKSVEAIFRNLHGYSSTLPPLPIQSRSSVQELTSSQTLFPLTAAAASIDELISASVGSVPVPPPSSRYFTLRVEFCKPVRTELLPVAFQTPLLPNCDDDEASTNANARADRNKGHATIGSHLNELVPTPLGNAGGNNMLGVNMVAFAKDFETDVGDEDPCIRKNVRIPVLDCDSEKMKIEGDSKMRNLRHLPAREEERKTPHTTVHDESATIQSVSRQSQGAMCARTSPEQCLLKHNVKAMAVPLGKEYSKYMQCTIIDHRIDKSSGKLDYKVKFVNKKMAQKCQQKQWVSSSNVLSLHAILSQIKDALKSRIRSCSNLLYAEVAREVRVSVKMVEKAAQSIDLRPYSTSKNQNKCDAAPLVESSNVPGAPTARKRRIGTRSRSITKKKSRYSFVASPIRVNF